MKLKLANDMFHSTEFWVNSYIEIYEIFHKFSLISSSLIIHTCIKQFCTIAPVIMQKNGKKIKSGLPIGDVKKYTQNSAVSWCHINSLKIVENT